MKLPSPYRLAIGRNGRVVMTYGFEDAGAAMAAFLRAIARSEAEPRITASTRIELFRDDELLDSWQTEPVH